METWPGGPMYLWILYELAPLYSLRLPALLPSWGSSAENVRSRERGNSIPLLAYTALVLIAGADDHWLLHTTLSCSSPTRILLTHPSKYKHLFKLATVRSSGIERQKQNCGISQETKNNLALWQDSSKKHYAIYIRRWYRFLQWKGCRSLYLKCGTDPHIPDPTVYVRTEL